MPRRRSRHSCTLHIEQLYPESSQEQRSLCNTIVGFVFQAGMLRGDHGEFWLEPVAVSPEEERVRLDVRLEDAGAELYRKLALGRPHLVFRRSVEQPQLEIGAAGRTRRRRKKKRKLERNCGTRGENPPTPFLLALSTLAFVHPASASSLSSFFLSFFFSFILFLYFL